MWKGGARGVAGVWVQAEKKSLTASPRQTGRAGEGRGALGPRGKKKWVQLPLGVFSGFSKKKIQQRLKSFGGILVKNENTQKYVLSSGEYS